MYTLADFITSQSIYRINRSRKALRQGELPLPVHHPRLPDSLQMLHLVVPFLVTFTPSKVSFDFICTLFFIHELFYYHTIPSSVTARASRPIVPWLCRSPTTRCENIVRYIPHLIIDSVPHPDDHSLSPRPPMVQFRRAYAQCSPAMAMVFPSVLEGSILVHR